LFGYAVTKTKKIFFLYRFNKKST